MDNTITDTLANILEAETETVQIPMFSCNFSRKGKGARGFFTLDTFGKSTVLDNGVTKELGYSHVYAYPQAAVIQLAEEAGYNVNKLILSKIDELNSENNGQGNLETFVSRIIAAGLEVDEYKAATRAKSIKNALDTFEAMGQPKTFDEVVEGMKAVISSQRSTTEIKPRLVDNRKQ
jgi:hypothetical protein